MESWDRIVVGNTNSLLTQRLRHCRQKEAALAKRKDARQAHVIISEKWDRKAQKYAATAVPFPFDGRDTYERSIRQPLGADFNTNASFR
jgi:U3 small nucleolar RNA-associated protein 14